MDLLDLVPVIKFLFDLVSSRAEVAVRRTPILIVLALLSMSCVVSQTLATFMATPTPACAPQVFIDQGTKIWARFFDAETRANSTARIALTTVIGAMQAARRDFSDLDYPACAATYRNAAIEAMDSSLYAYFSFMSQATDATVATKMNYANDRMSHAGDELNKLKAQVTPPAR